MNAAAQFDSFTALRSPKDVGAILRARRKELGWDQSTLASKIGVTRLWVSQVENGKPGASLGLVLQAFASLGLVLKAMDKDLVSTSVRVLTPVEPVDLDAIVADALMRGS